MYVCLCVDTWDWFLSVGVLLSLPDSVYISFCIWLCLRICAYVRMKFYLRMLACVFMYMCRIFVYAFCASVLMWVNVRDFMCMLVLNVRMCLWLCLVWFYVWDFVWSSILFFHLRMFCLCFRSCMSLFVFFLSRYVYLFVHVFVIVFVCVCVPGCDCVLHVSWQKNK